MWAYVRYLLGISLAAVHITVLATDVNSESPWLTGPLIAAAGNTVEAGHTNYEPYLFVTNNYASYNNNWRAINMPALSIVNPLLSLTQGLAKGLDFQLILPYDFNYRQDHSNDGWGDLTLLVGVQVINSTRWPSLRVTLGEIFPSGKYTNLDPNELSTDSRGAGAYQTAISFNFQKQFNLPHQHFLVARLNLSGNFFQSVKVHGFNAYGGGFGTDGLANIGEKFGSDLGLEYTLTRHWAAALDVVYNYGEPNTFNGIVGRSANGIPATNDLPTQEVVSLAPALEYNFNAQFGIISGCWFTAAGRNQLAFNSWVFAINYYH